MKIFRICVILMFSVSFAIATPLGGINTVTAPAFRMPAQADSFHSALKNEMINWGDSLKTGPRGFMGILFQDGSLLKMAGSTEIKLVSPEDSTKHITVKMKLGDLWAKIIRAEQSFEIHTPSSIASVKGTKFWIMVSPNGDSRLLCQEGLVDFMNIISGERMFVREGQMSVCYMNGTIKSVEINPEEPEEPQPDVPESIEPPEKGEEGTPSVPSAEGEAPVEPSQTPPTEGGIGLNMNGAVGATTIDGINYQYFSFRPGISIWKFGIGLDLSFYFDSEGNIRDEEWDEFGDYIDKIYYLRYGKTGDPLYIRVGSLSPITLGYGLIMRRYTNSIEWPQVRRIGLQTEIRRGPFTFTGVINNFREIDTPGLIGLRLTYEKKIMLPVVVGGTIVYDGNQYLGAKDSDGDGVPNQWDMFPGKDDFSKIDWLRGFLEPGEIDTLIGSGDLPNINNPPMNISDSTESVTEWGIDVGIPLIRNKLMNLWVYTQMAQIVDYGKGFTFPGVKFTMGPFNAGAEYRIFEKEFMPDFFDLSYETQRVVWNEEDSTFITKEDKLEDIPKAQGYYIEAGLNLFSLIDLFAAYQQMSYDGQVPGKTIYGKLNLNTKFIPKLQLAEAYYQQPNVDDIFKTKSDGTIVGYRLGVEIGNGVMLLYDNKTIYYDGKPNKIMTIETALTF